MSDDQLTLDGSKYRVAHGRQAGMSLQQSFNVLGFPPSLVKRARERGVHPSEIRQLRDDYAAVFRPRWPWPCVTGLGRRMIDASAFDRTSRNAFPTVETTDA